MLPDILYSDWLHFTGWLGQGEVTCKRRRFSRRNSCKAFCPGVGAAGEVGFPATQTPRWHPLRGGRWSWLGRSNHATRQGKSGGRSSSLLQLPVCFQRRKDKGSKAGLDSLSTRCSPSLPPSQKASCSLTNTSPSAESEESWRNCPAEGNRQMKKSCSFCSTVSKGKWITVSLGLARARVKPCLKI